MGTVYLLHFDQKIGNPDNPRAQAQHYIGYADNLTGRLKHHRNGTSGASIVSAFHAKGIKFQVARKWEGADRSFERRLKKRKEANRLCPICCKAAGRKPKPAPYTCEGVEHAENQ